MADRVLVAQAIAVHLCIAALLRAVGLRRVMAWSDARTPARSRHMICPDAETRVAWAVRTAAYLLPMGRTCLTEALAAQFLIRRRGGDATLRFGVAKGAPLAAHAWLEAAGRIVIGESAVQFRPLVPRKEGA